MPKRPTDTGSIASASGSGIDIRSGIVSALVVRASELHVPTHPWFAGMRVQASDFSDPANPPYLAYREACRIIQRALDALPGDGHGLEQGARQSLAEFGLLGLAMLTAPTLKDALHIGIGFAPITGAMLDLAVEDDPAGVAVSMRMRMRTHEPALEAFLCEEFIASSLNLCRGLMGKDFAADRIDLAYPPPRYAARYSEVLGTKIRFNRPSTRVVIAQHWLDRPMPAANAESARQISALCRAQMPSEQPPAGIVAAIEQRLALQVAEMPRLTDFAAELHLTERTLRRHQTSPG